VPGLAVLFAVRYHRARTMLHQLLTRLVGITERLLRRPLIEPEAVEAFLDRVAGIRLTWPRYSEVFLLAVLNWVADCGCLACAILAAGQPVPWHGLLLAYGAGATAGSTGVTPGGFALVEIALTAALVASGMNAGGALTAVLAYRLVNFWLILLGGAIAMIVLSRRGRIRHYASPGRHGQAGRHSAGQQPAGQQPAGQHPAAQSAGGAAAGTGQDGALGNRGQDS
jgi:putative heme transporter